MGSGYQNINRPWSNPEPYRPPPRRRGNGIDVTKTDVFGKPKKKITPSGIFNNWHPHEELFPRLDVQLPHAKPRKKGQDKKPDKKAPIVAPATVKKTGSDKVAQELLANTAKYDKQYEKRIKAVKNLTDLDVLLNVANYDTNDIVRKVASNRLKSLVYARMKADGNQTDIDAVVNAANFSKNRNARREARKKLKELYNARVKAYHADSPPLTELDSDTQGGR